MSTDLSPTFRFDGDPNDLPSLKMHLEAHVAVKKAGLTEARGNATEDDIKRLALFSLVDRHIMRKLARQPQPLDTDQNPRK